ncbi:uncharacterized protein ACLA_006470 [Aspergillus clavatus NRRL 1]|uniref:Uncharacterized protein n=1 Tax=Aspergillus clavatus (strain ATCC 1007 / CBS 513.65 / DSM 816 / NCTC 3887 / NRRL 1 / QM 1276 / 107) TaxID=344612 RepID=A1CDG3_ASPCL|nr:uncharacterized protein ACLA_006470 [Aspergillus clavatus NRRL 1]EAW11890.1 hypothetical protein ACLA_006470 [Aspergillus clavatus NRRL 1]
MYSRDASVIATSSRGSFPGAALTNSFSEVTGFVFENTLKLGLRQHGPHKIHELIAEKMFVVALLVAQLLTVCRPYSKRYPLA